MKEHFLMNKVRWLLIPLLLALPVLAGCRTAEPEPETTAATVAVETETTVETTVPPTAPPDGDPGNVTCQGSYTVSDSEAVSAADTVVASIGDSRLTNRMLQVYYWLEVAQYQAENPEVVFDQPLDTILCDLDDTAVTWQQYFLQRALNTWHSHQALYLRAGDVDLPTEEAYSRNEEYHEININEDMPAVAYLYGYVHENYQPNDMHQAYLDALPELLGELAAANGFASPEAQAVDLAGPAADAEALVNYAWLYNWSYMYYTQLTYDMDFTGEEVEAFYLENQAAYEAEGITADSGSYVTIRQILLVPEGATVAADGTVTADEEAWEACGTAAEAMLASWRKSVTNARRFARADNVDEALFGELAVSDSADAGSRADGGLYSGLRRGQLVAALDEWCFDDARQNGDSAVIRTDCGYHLVYFVSSEEVWYARAEADMRAQQTLELFSTALEEYAMEVDYSAISLGLAARSGEAILADDVLYPDIAHERYPSAPVYLQQDYPHTRYGQYPISTHGCGITTLAMLASYMTDEELTPPELCKVYGYYNTEHGSNFSMFEQTPSEMGFYMVKSTLDWDEVVAALENGQVVVSLQKQGYWTKGGHFILLQDITEDGLIQVKDSNLYNYGKLSGHQIDGHEADTITPKSAMYWIYYPKVTSIPACVRCGDTAGEGVVTAMFTEDYHCDRCDAAMERRMHFVSACDSVK